MNRLFLLGVALLALHAQAQNTQLNPPAQRISDAAISADQQAYEALQGRIKGLNDRGRPVKDYFLSKAQCWLDVSFHEYSRNDRSPFTQEALTESEKLIKGMEANVSPLPFFAGSTFSSINKGRVLGAEVSACSFVQAQDWLAGTEHLHADWQLVEDYPLSPALLAMSRVWQSPDRRERLIAAKGAPADAVIHAIEQLLSLGQRLGRDLVPSEKLPPRIHHITLVQLAPPPKLQLQLLATITTFDAATRMQSKRDRQ